MSCCRHAVGPGSCSLAGQQAIDAARGGTLILGHVLTAVKGGGLHSILADWEPVLSDH